MGFEWVIIHPLQIPGMHLQKFLGTQKSGESSLTNKNKDQSWILPSSNQTWQLEIPGKSSN